MHVFAYSAASFEQAVRKAAGVQPLLSPPLNLHTFPLQALSDADFLYFSLHGLQDQPYWYGDNWLTAIAAEHIRHADLSGATVFAANCFLDHSPMLDALLHAGASAVVGGAGPNYATTHSVHGAHLLGRSFRRLCQIGLAPQIALRLAKARLHLQRRLDTPTLDALQFQLYT